MIHKALKYARAHPQPVRIAWLDREPEVIGAVEAVELCSDPRVSGFIIAALADDKRLEELLNKVIDGD